ncbi:MAG: hypothetical protein EZS28_005002 [Streblomastix strix]|uniref:Uncharacterized protein n=1 Tax=Streblomastix strix TaxID=222440 RepID=A0A5J4WWR2_9EUKA|nr:MAG: hypothetical protein EZS28_005002 [Streblomastix strix]
MEIDCTKVAKASARDNTDLLQLCSSQCDWQTLRTKNEQQKYDERRKFKFICSIAMLISAKCRRSSLAEHAIAATGS